MRVDGDLVLSFATVRPPLILWNCHVSACPNFLQTTFPFLTLSGSRLEYGLIGDRMRVDAGLFCRDGFTAKGDVRLLGAQIGGDADFSKATLDNPGSNALSADRIRITGSLFCRNGFVTRGNVILPLAKIDGIFECKPATWSGRLQMMHARAGQWRDNWNGSRWTCDGEPRIDLRDFSYGTFGAAPQAPTPNPASPGSRPRLATASPLDPTKRWPTLSAPVATTKAPTPWPWKSAATRHAIACALTCPHPGEPVSASR